MAAPPQVAPPSTAAPGKPAHRWAAVYAWGVLGYTLLVILWGAYVRAAGAGNGCGANWPRCDGQFLPHAPGLKMLIEFLHRVSSGVDAVLILGLWAGARWLYPRRHRMRKASTFALVFIGIEALLGAALVLFGWVGTNASAARITADALHLVNTLLLLAALVLAAAWASGLGPLARRWWHNRSVSGSRGEAARGPAPVNEAVWLGIGLGAVLVTAVCGVMASLADTLYPSASLAAGMRLDFTQAAPVLDRLRVIHPAVAILTGLFLIYLVLDRLPAPPGRAARVLGYGVALAVLAQWSAGAADLLLLTPIPMQMLHLFCADLLWMALVAYTAARFAVVS